MFNKKENIEDDFMGYSSNSNNVDNQKSKSGNGGLGSTIQFLIIFILLGVIAVGGMFGYKYLQKDTPKQDINIANTNTQPKQVANTQPIAQVVENKKATKSSSDTQKMYTQEQMQEIVKMMMANMQNKSKNSQIDEETTNESDDNELINSLSNIDVDQMDDLSVDNSDETDTTQKVTDNSNDKVDRYNKIVIDNTHGDLDDLASQLNDTIDTLDQQNSKKSTYTKSISNEISTRKNEMRVIVVKSGDSLSKIAARAYGSASAYITIMEANPDLIKNPNRIYVGQRLRVPLKIN